MQRSQNVRWPESLKHSDGQQPNFEIFARPYHGETLGEAVNLSQNPASDVTPAIAADSQGRIWLAWQAVRDGVFGQALVERLDFGAGASAHSLKMLHGGIRYLQHLDMKRLRESCRERGTFLRIAPHLTR